MRVPLLAATLGSAIVIVSACGGGTQETSERHREISQAGTSNTGHSAAPSAEEPIYLSVTLAGRQGPEDAGIEMAYSHGLFDRPGPEVGIASPLTLMRPIRYVVEGTDNIGVSHLPQVALAVEKGVPIIAVGSLMPRPAATMIWLKESGIRSVADLKGKTVAIPGLPFQKALLEAILTRQGVPPDEVKVIRAGYGLAPILASGRADAIFGGNRYTEGVELKSRGLQPVITPVTALGVPRYEELVWIARTDFAAENPTAIRSFLAGVNRGTTSALKRPLAAARILGESPETVLQLSPEEMAEGVKAASTSLSTSGRMSFAKANLLLDWMRNQGLIKRRLPTSKLLTNRFLPKAEGS
jgi:putative hydroxymethylpyrimidine transport system substrate-binding protein